MPVTIYPFSSLHSRCTEQGGKWEREKFLLLRMLGQGRNKAGFQQSMGNTWTRIRASNSVFKLKLKSCHSPTTFELLAGVCPSNIICTPSAWDFLFIYVVPLGWPGWQSVFQGVINLAPLMHGSNCEPETPWSYVFKNLKGSLQEPSINMTIQFSVVNNLFALGNSLFFLLRIIMTTKFQYVQK